MSRTIRVVPLDSLDPPPSLAIRPGRSTLWYLGTLFAAWLVGLAIALAGPWLWAAVTPWWLAREQAVLDALGYALGYALFAVLLVVYFLPTYLLYAAQKAKVRSVLVCGLINLLLGWTVGGWVLLLERAMSIMEE